MGAAVSNVYYNCRLRHPTLDMPMIDYDLALLIQPMLMLGISVGVAFNVIFLDWMITVSLIILFLGKNQDIAFFAFDCKFGTIVFYPMFASTSTKAFLKGCETWKKETIYIKEAAKRLKLSGVFGTEVEYVHQEPIIKTIRKKK